MRFKRHLRQEQGFNAINIAPLINVLLLLLIFFMIAPSFVSQTAVRLDLPKVVTAEVLGAHSLEVMLTAQGQLFIGKEEVSEKELSDYLRTAAAPGKTVLIKADKHAALDRIFTVWDACRKAGLTAVHIATDTP